MKQLIIKLISELTTIAILKTDRMDIYHYDAQLFSYMAKPVSNSSCMHAVVTMHACSHAKLTHHDRMSSPTPYHLTPNVLFIYVDGLNNILNLTRPYQLN